MKPRAAWLYLRVAQQTGLEPPRRARSMGLAKRLARYIQAEQGRGTFRLAVNAELAAEAFFAGTAGFVLAHDVTYAKFPAASTEAYLQTYVDLFLPGLEA